MQEGWKVSEDEVAPTSPLKGKSGFQRICNACVNSMAGLAAAWSENAFRQEVLIAAVMIPIACWVPVAPVERALLIAVVLLVLIVELVNSAIEAAVDRISFDRHPLSKRAKDIGSAAVMIALALCVSVWAVILLPHL